MLVCQINIKQFNISRVGLSQLIGHVIPLILAYTVNGSNKIESVNSYMKKFIKSKFIESFVD